MRITMTAAFMLLLAGTGWAQTESTDDLERRVEAQDRQIEELQQRLARLESVLLGETAGVTAPRDSVARVIPISTRAVEVQPAPSVQPVAAQAQAQPQIAGFRFSGDIRFRFDAAVRSSTATTTGLQNIRQRYRLRMNVDRDILPNLNFHMQMTTGAVNNGLTFDQDFAGGVTRHPFFVSEAFVEYKPDANVSLRGGKLEEVFADNTRFLWDDDVRFNGFNERWKLGRVEFRAGQYFFVNPNVYSVPANSPLIFAGVTPGTIARSATMFHQGMTFEAALSDRWRNQAIADVQLFRNPNLLALTSNPNGFAATLNPAVGISLSGPAPGTGNATTSPSNSILTAPHYQVVRAAYKLDRDRLGGDARFPLSWSVQVARNVGTSQVRDAIMTTVSVGRTQEKGEIRGLYTFAIKDANSMISQLTDDDLGTGVGTNIGTHHFRLDYALRRGIVFQNLIFRQTQREASNPADPFFVPLGPEAGTTWRYQGQLAISF